ncbi:uncharacterized protein B0H18DRAFT_966340, partial [Fomitopsis serialis]|uniref:uncharacterized protein n=1 Tax=Fomitopsis serialis TaxID=139415 RepID=UPI002008A6A6
MSRMTANGAQRLTDVRASYIHRQQHSLAFPPPGASLSPAVFSNSATAQDGRDLHTSFQGLGIRGEASGKSSVAGANRHAVETKDHPSPTSTTSRAKQGVARTVRGRRPSRALESDNEWLQYTKPFKMQGANWLRCTWADRLPDGNHVECTYVQKRHLVKRHICSKHLGIRPWDCPMCDKSFAQLSNLETHINTHTGDRPHECPFCEERFKDPARCCRHKKDVHGYITARERKMLKDLYGTSDPEFTDSEDEGTDPEAAFPGPMGTGTAAPLHGRR